MKNEDGFTLMETLCAITLLLICAGAAGGLAYNTRRVTSDVKEHSRQHYRQIQIERLIREAIENISIPYWEEDEKGITAAREAIEKALLGAGYKNGFEIKTLKDGTERIRGVSCRFFVDGQEYEGAGLFASISLERE